ncbi:MAG: response regulator [Phycisphaerales bacterium]|nr:MAG: response regulator [Phycisphaerales bacterium]
MGNQPTADSDRWTVLVVDDNRQNLELLLAYLEDMEEVTAIEARDGVGALEQVARCKPDLILLDIMMPKMSGFEVCKQLKSNPQTRDIPVVMVTALNETADIERATECGTDDYITKPIERRALVNLVRTMLHAKAHR